MMEYPKCLYRFPAQTGQVTEIEGLAFEYLIVAGENAELDAKRNGWANVPTIPVSELQPPTEPAEEPKHKKQKHKP